MMEVSRSFSAMLRVTDTLRPLYTVKGVMATFPTVRRIR